MGIIEKIQERTRDEYVSLLKFQLARLSGLIQQKPLPYFAAGVGIGMVFIVFFRLLWPLILIALCVTLVVYFMAPAKKIG